MQKIDADYKRRTWKTWAKLFKMRKPWYITRLTAVRKLVGSQVWKKNQSLPQLRLLWVYFMAFLHAWTKEKLTTTWPLLRHSGQCRRYNTLCNFTNTRKILQSFFRHLLALRISKNETFSSKRKTKWIPTSTYYSGCSKKAFKRFHT